MSEKNIALAVAYYQAMGNKNLATIEKLLHPDVRLISPMAQIEGKDAVLNAVKHFLAVFNTLTIRAKFGSGDQAMVVYNLDCSAPFGIVRGVMNFFMTQGLLSKNEMRYLASLNKILKNNTLKFTTILMYYF